MKIKYFASVLAGIIVFSILTTFADSYHSDNIENKAKIESKVIYDDVSEDNWFYDDVINISGKGLMNGTSNKIFSPTDNTNRAMIVTILWRLEGMPLEGENSFEDVKKEQYYYDAVSWATKNKIVNGYDANTFAPTDYATREQLVSIMYRYAKYKKCDLSNAISLYKFKDVVDVSEYAIGPLEWGVANGIISGTSAITLSPTEYVQRCQVAAIFNRFCNKYNLDIVSGENGESVTENKTGDKKEDLIIGDNIVDKNNPVTSPEDTQLPVYGGGPSDEESFEPPEEENIQIPIITTNIGYGNPGDIVTVVLDLEQNPGILGMVLSLKYDDTAMRLIGVTNGEAVADVLTLTPSKELACDVKFVWDGLDLTDNDIKDGTLLTLEFEIFDDVVIGKRYPLTLKYDFEDILDVDFNPLQLQIKQGYIEITGGE